MSYPNLKVLPQEIRRKCPEFFSEQDAVIQQVPAAEGAKNDGSDSNVLVFVTKGLSDLCIFLQLVLPDVAKGLRAIFKGDSNIEDNDGAIIHQDEVRLEGDSSDSLILPEDFPPLGRGHLHTIND